MIPFIIRPSWCHFHGAGLWDNHKKERVCPKTPPRKRHCEQQNSTISGNSLSHKFINLAQNKTKIIDNSRSKVGTIGNLEDSLFLSSRSLLVAYPVLSWTAVKWAAQQSWIGNSFENDWRHDLFFYYTPMTSWSIHITNSWSRYNITSCV